MGPLVNYGVKYVEKASRLELLIRILWSIPSFIVMVVLGIVYCVAYVLQLLYILFLGKRHHAMHNWMFSVMDYEIRWKSYISMLTDERNPLLPPD